MCGLSPALFGFYKLSVWGPIALFVLAVLLGLTIARPASPRPTALVAIGGLVFLWLWSLASVGWSESADQALLDANRWMLYAAVFAVLVLLLRDDRLGRLLMATATAAVVAFGLYLCARLLLPDSGEMFLNRRLNDPLGYVNGQAGYLLLALWPLVAARGEGALAPSLRSRGERCRAPGRPRAARPDARRGAGRDRQRRRARGRATGPQRRACGRWSRLPQAWRSRPDPY